MLKKLFVILIGFAAVQAFCQVHDPVDEAKKFIDHENQQAEVICSNIINDQGWVSLMGRVSKLNDIYEKYPRDNSAQFSRTSGILISLLDVMSNDLKLEADDKKNTLYKLDINLDNYSVAEYYRLRENRVMMRCGDGLIKKGLVLIGPIFSLNSSAEKQREKNIKTLNNSNLCVKEHDKIFITSYASLYSKLKNSNSSAQQSAQDEFFKSTLRIPCMMNIERDMKSALFFPLYKLGNSTKSNINIEKYSYAKDIPLVVDQNYASASERLGVAIEKNIDQKNKKEEDDRRLSQIKSGKFEYAKTCGDFAKAFISSGNIMFAIGNYPISKNNEIIQIKPSGEYYASIGKVINIERNKIITYDRNQFNNQPSAAILNLTSKTKLFSSGFIVGRNIYYVGKYVGNEQISINENSNKFALPARTYEVICASQM